MDDEGGMFGGGHGLFNGVQGMGILNALRTGDPRVDMVLALMFPFILKQALEWFRIIQEKLSQGWMTEQERTIVHRASLTQWGGSYSKEDTQNTILQKAISLYLHSKLNLTLKEAQVELTSTEDNQSNLVRRNSWDSDEEEETTTVFGALKKYKLISKPKFGQWYDLGIFGLEKDERCQVRLLISRSEEARTPQAVSTDLTISYRFKARNAKAIDAFIDQAYKWYMEQLREMEDHTARFLYELKPADRTASKKKDGEEDNLNGRVYTRYRLSDEKTFDSLFFSQKEALLKILDQFRERSGKYAIKGYPHKLGLLLHGAPGTGKTSLIKALAQYTNRSIVNVPLTRVDTNSELMEIFNDPRKCVDGESVPVRLGFKDVIFVMEDVDAASGIVKRRDGKKTADMVQVDQLDMPLPKPLFHMLLESNEDSCKDLVGKLIEKSERLEKEAARPELIKNITRKITSVPGLSVVGETGDDPSLKKISADVLGAVEQLMNDQKAMNEFLQSQAHIINNLLERGAEVDEELVDDLLGLNAMLPPLPNMASREISYTKYGDEGEPHVELGRQLAQQELLSQLTTSPESSSADQGQTKAGESSLVAGPLSAWAIKKIDELNLSGLLNVLDGVVDSPGRILVMTTNHVEHLDPALIRPGRIDKKLLLGYMAPSEVVQMLEHYFQTTLDDLQKRRIEAAITGDGQRPQLKLTPAQIEQMTAEHEEVEAMIAAVEAKGGLHFGPYRGQASKSSMVAFDL